MAIANVVGLEELLKTMEDISKLPVSVLDDILNAQADVAVKAQRETASTMLRGPYYKDGVAGAVIKKCPSGLRDGRQIYITFDGKQHGIALSEIAFLNEYGTSEQPARQFIRTANEQKATEIQAAGERAYEAWLTKSGL